MLTVSNIEARLCAAFPPRVVEGVIAPHDCDECNALRAQLKGALWDSVLAAFLDSNDGALPLLSQDAYIAFLPAWLRRAVREPSGSVASMMLVNLRMDSRTAGFTPEQPSVIVDVARFIVAENGFPPDDPVNVKSLAAIERAWAPKSA